VSEEEEPDQKTRSFSCTNDAACKWRGTQAAIRDRLTTKRW